MRPWGNAVVCCLGRSLEGKDTGRKASTGSSMMLSCFETRFLVFESLSQGLLWPAVSCSAFHENTLHQPHAYPSTILLIIALQHLHLRWALEFNQLSQLEIAQSSSRGTFFGSAREYQDKKSCFCFHLLKIASLMIIFIQTSAPYKILASHAFPLFLPQLPQHTVDHFLAAPSNAHVIT
jgi:hypothetical protein